MEAQVFQHDTGSTGRAGSVALMPVPPSTVEETGLPFFFLLELVAKHLFRGGPQRASELAARLHLLPGVMESLLVFMRDERLIEVQARTHDAANGAMTKDFTYVLSDLGRDRAGDAMARCQYAGPAPVSLAHYVRQVAQQSFRDERVTQEAVRRNFGGEVIRPGLLEQFGAAMNSGRAMFVYGPPGAGKTYIAERLVGLMAGAVYIPYALYVDGEVIQVYDPLVHQPMEMATESKTRIERHIAQDGRWVRCARPVVLNGGELSLSMLDLQFDSESRYYTAPPQVKANNGLLIIDDLGRQLSEPRVIMNRWIVPMDRQIDYLSLHTGVKFRVPFDLSLVFSTNLPPSSLADEAFLRRLGYKIYVGYLDEASYGEIFKRVCQEMGVLFTKAGLTYVLKRHEREHKPLLACIPRDLVGQVRDHAAYMGQTPELEEGLLDWAWNNYFVHD